MGLHFWPIWLLFPAPKHPGRIIYAVYMATFWLYMMDFIALTFSFHTIFEVCTSNNRCHLRVSCSAIWMLIRVESSFLAFCEIHSEDKFVPNIPSCFSLHLRVQHALVKGNEKQLEILGTNLSSLWISQKAKDDDSTRISIRIVLHEVCTPINYQSSLLLYNYMYNILHQPKT